MANKIRSKAFWCGIIGTVIILLQQCGVKVDVPYVNEVVEAVSAVLVLLGIIVPDTQISNRTEALPSPEDTDDNSEE